MLPERGFWNGCEQALPRAATQQICSVFTSLSPYRVSARSLSKYPIWRESTSPAALFFIGSISYGVREIAFHTAPIAPLRESSPHTQRLVRRDRHNSPRDVIRPPLSIWPPIQSSANTLIWLFFFFLVVTLFQSSLRPWSPAGLSGGDEPTRGNHFQRAFYAATLVHSPGPHVYALGTTWWTLHLLDALLGSSSYHRTGKSQGAKMIHDWTLSLISIHYYYCFWFILCSFRLHSIAFLARRHLWDANE